MLNVGIKAEWEARKCESISDSLLQTPISIYIRYWSLQVWKLVRLATSIFILYCRCHHAAHRESNPTKCEAKSITILWRQISQWVSRNKILACGPMLKPGKNKNRFGASWIPLNQIPNQTEVSLSLCLKPKMLKRSAEPNPYHHPNIAQKLGSWLCCFWQKLLPIPSSLNLLPNFF